MDTATIRRITKARGVAGEIAFTAFVTYPGEGESCVTFHGSVYGGPVVMVTAGNPRGTFVTNPDRFGEFGEAWVRAFFA